MRTTRDRTPWDGMFPIDSVTSFTCVHLGIEYRGEVVRAGRWSSKLTGAPGDGSHFKIVLLQERPRGGLPKKLDQKTAICVPASGSGP